MMVEENKKGRKRISCINPLFSTSVTSRVVISDYSDVAYYDVVMTLACPLLSLRPNTSPIWMVLRHRRVICFAYAFLSVSEEATTNNITAARRLFNLLQKIFIITVPLGNPSDQGKHMWHWELLFLEWATQTQFSKKHAQPRIEKL